MSSPLLLPSLGAGLGLLLFFFQFFSSGGELISGEIGDNRLLVAILEHWRAWAQGLVHWASPNFFAPTPGVLGYSVTIALYAPAYIVARAIGLDPFLSIQISFMALKLAGYVGLYLLLRRHAGYPIALSTFGALLFTVSNIYSASIGHGQLIGLALFPVVLLFALESWRARPRIAVSCLWAAAAGALYGLMFFTEYYMPFFCGLACGVVAVMFAILQLPRTTPEQRAALLHGIPRTLPQLACFAAAFGIALIPFLALYLPVLRSHGGRAFGDVQVQTLGPIQLVNPGPANFSWGGVVQQSPEFFEMNIPRETGRGWPFFTAGLFAVSAFAIIRLAFANAASPYQRFLAATALGVLVLALGAAHYGPIYPWRFIHEYVPGAAGVRVPGRINHVLNLGVVLLITDTLRRMLHSKAAQGDFTRTLTIHCFAVLLIVEQLNWNAFPGCSRSAELARLNRVPPPPTSCRAFVVTDSDRTGPGHANIDAMLVARRFNVPTINGYSGMVPAGWSCDAGMQSCAQSLRQWAASQGLTSGVCSLDMRANRWSEPAPPAAIQ